jgi:hypothetical protein
LRKQKQNAQKKNAQKKNAQKKNAGENPRRFYYLAKLRSIPAGPPQKKQTRHRSPGH